VASTAQARENHEELFPGHVSTLAATDPELIEYFDNFAFDEVLRHGDLDTPCDGAQPFTESGPAALVEGRWSVTPPGWQGLSRPVC
jgi:hypothetical protein